MDYRKSALLHLEKALDTLKTRRVRIYLSPMSGAQLRLLQQGGREHELAQWRSDMRAFAQARGLAFTDLINTHPFDDFDPQKGSSAFWIDNMHFKPEVGNWVLKQIGAL